MLHFATFFAIIIYFRKEWVDILRGGFLSVRNRTLKGSGQSRLFWSLIIASMPAVIFGLIFGEKLEHYFRDTIMVALMLGIFGLVLYIAELYGKRNKSLADITWQLSLLIGFSQILAVIPGVSRSCITISAALMLGMNRESSVRFSFLMAAPIIFAAACYGIKEIWQMYELFSWHILLVGFVVSFLSSLTAIHFLLKYIRKQPFTIFVIYRLAVSIIVIVTLFWKSGGRL
jgi:undecaprenyl-diphosphatase